VRLPLLLALALTPFACAPARAPEREALDASALVAPLSVAFATEAHGTEAAAVTRYLELLEATIHTRPDAWHIGITHAALDALVARTITPFTPAGLDSALIYRTPDPSLTRSESLAVEERQANGIAARLSRAYAAAEGPFAPGLIAEAMTEIAEHRGDAEAAARWREATGCAREATVVGPLDWAPLTGVYREDPLGSFDAKLAAGYSAPGGFATVFPPVVERGRGCAIDLSAASSNAGVRDVVVDVLVKKEGRVGLLLRSSATATLRVGGKLVIDRPYELGGGNVSRFASVVAKPGTLRIVARVGMDQEGETIRIAAWDEAGKPLTARAPRPGDAGTVAVTEGEAISYPVPHRPLESLGVALAALAAQDFRTAEYVLEAEATRPDASPDIALAYARAVENAQDLTSVHRIERARAAYDRTLAVWPDAWEAMLGEAWLAGSRRGPGDARFARIDALGALRPHASQDGARLLDLFVVLMSGREHLWDRARDALERVTPALGATSLYADSVRNAFDRSAADLVAYDCGAHAGEPRPRASLSCYYARRAEGDLRGALAELERVRSVRGGVDLFLPFTLKDGLALGDRAIVERAVRDMLPAERTLSSLYGLESLGAPGATRPREVLLEELAKVMATVHDAPLAIAPLERALHDDPTTRWKGVAEAVVAEDRAHPVLPGAATAVLRHEERYDIAKTGVVHAVVFDLRRVTGTTDVEENAQAQAPALVGRTSLRILRRRVLKHDGTIVEPDPNPGAAQAHADLAQLEAGDVVEAIYEGWSIPMETGEIGIDTVDLLPPRTAVHEATVEIHLPASLKLALWTHPILGPPKSEVVGDETVLRWQLHDHLARRVEDGTPKMDRSVAVSLSTARWSEIGRGLREALAARTDHDPAVLVWARGVVRDAHAETDRAKIDAVVAAVGSAIKEGDPADLSDILYGHAMGPQSTTARGILSDHEGNRTWLIARALRELGIPCDVMVAENDPFSASADFPPHLGRFMHPIALAHPRDSGGDAAIPIDADVSGPPLPAGHISPELRGRQALHEDGTIAPLPLAATALGDDEIDERLTVDERGDARGTFTILLRGHEAQDIAEMLLRNVGDQRQKALRGVVLAWVPFANVDSVELSSSEGSWQIALRADVTIPGYAQEEGKSARGVTWIIPGIDPVHWTYPRGSASTLSATYATEGARESALAVSHAVQYHAHRRIELPRGATLARTPGPYEVRTGPLTASRKIRVSVGPPVVFEDDVALGVPTGTIPASAYAGFVKDAHTTDDALLATTAIRMPSPTTKP
jgi:hypothetical protein